MLRPYVSVCMSVCVGLSVCLCVGRGCPVELACLIKLKYFGKPRNSFPSWFSHSHSADADRRLSVPDGSRVARGTGGKGQGPGARGNQGAIKHGSMWMWITVEPFRLHA